MQAWSNEFGKNYTDRNLRSPEETDVLFQSNLGLTRSQLNEEFLGNLDRNIAILEVGSNVANQLVLLQKMGFSRLYGIDVQYNAINLACERTQGIHFVRGTAFDIPFKDNFFDLVFTSGVLIHIHPMDIETTLSEIYRCTKSYIWGYEYYSAVHENIVYRGRKDLLWRGNFVQLYLKHFPDLSIIKEKRFPYLDLDQSDSMFLLCKSKS